jgi:glycosyltransferase involved in cell wall biosynthesis
MIKVLFANTNYPDRYNLWAPWNRLANTALSRSGSVDPEIVVPRPYTLPFRFFPQHQLCGLPVSERASEGLIHYPRFPYLVPKKYMYAASFDLYRHFIGKYVRDQIGRKDLVHAHHVFLDGYGMIDVCKKWEVPLVVDVHGDAVFTGLVHDPLIGKKMAKTLNYSSKIICISRNLCSLAKSFGLDEEKLEYVPLGIDLCVYKPGDRHAAKDASGLAGKTVLLYVGHLTEGKGVSYLLKAMAGLDSRLLSRLMLIIVGDGPDRKMLERVAGELGIDRQVYFAGSMPPGEVMKWYAVADIFVLPSLSEGRPTVINEAMATGCAIVATDISGIPEQVTDGYNGFLVPPRDSAALREKIAYLAGAEEEIARMGRNSRKKLLDEDLTWERYADRMTGIYRQIADSEGN